VDNRVHVSGVQGLENRVRVADVRFDERKPPTRKILNPLLLDCTGIKRIEIVYGRDAVGVVQQSAAKMSTNEPGAAGDSDMHRSDVLVQESLFGPLKTLHAPFRLIA
jgi:hypothetical protein